MECSYLCPISSTSTMLPKNPSASSVSTSIVPSGVFHVSLDTDTGEPYPVDWDQKAHRYRLWGGLHRHARPLFQNKHIRHAGKQPRGPVSYTHLRAHETP